MEIGQVAGSRWPTPTASALIEDPSITTRTHSTRRNGNRSTGRSEPAVSRRPLRTEEVEGAQPTAIS
jgi:hypothetical protein